MAGRQTAIPGRPGGSLSVWRWLLCRHHGPRQPPRTKSPSVIGLFQGKESPVTVDRCCRMVTDCSDIFFGKKKLLHFARMNLVFVACVIRYTPSPSIKFNQMDTNTAPNIMRKICFTLYYAGYLQCRIAFTFRRFQCPSDLLIVLHTSIHGLPTDGRPRHTWLRTLEADLQPLNHGLNLSLIHI